MEMEYLVLILKVYSDGAGLGDGRTVDFYKGGP